MSRKPLWIAGTAALLAMPFNAAAHDEPVAGTLVGAGVGAAVAGPPGAAVGAVLGAVIGATVAHRTDHGHRHDHRHHSRAVIERRERVTSVAPVGYRGNGYMERTATCDADRPGYRAKVVHVDDRVRTAPPAAKSRLKKVCRYVRVRNTDTAATRVTSPAG